jgi:hypothetical protein
MKQITGHERTFSDLAETICSHGDIGLTLTIQGPEPPLAFVGALCLVVPCPFLHFSPPRRYSGQGSWPLNCAVKVS